MRKLKTVGQYLVNVGCGAWVSVDSAETARILCPDYDYKDKGFNCSGLPDKVFIDFICVVYGYKGPRHKKTKHIEITKRKLTNLHLAKNIRIYYELDKEIEKSICGFQTKSDCYANLFRRAHNGWVRGGMGDIGKWVESPFMIDPVWVRAGSEN